MGHAISKRAKFSNQGALDFTRGNELLLNDLLTEVQDIVQSHPEEAALVFQSPLVWVTRLGRDAFRGAAFEDNRLNTPLSSSGNLVSADKGPKGQNVFQLEGTQVKVWNFNYLGKLFAAASDKRINEIQAALQANRDPLANILGGAYAGAGDLLEVHKKGVGDSAEFRLCLLLNQIDVKLLHSSVEQMTKETRLNIESVSAEVELLRNFAGIEDEHCLESIDWESAYVFANGLRSPPWRQVHGDLAYIVAKPVGGDMITVMANINGYWAIKGQDGDDMDYDRVGEVYATLVALLRAKSTHFAENIEKQTFKYKASPTKKVDAKVFLNSDAYITQPQTVDEANDFAQTAKKSTSRKAKGTQRGLQPSTRWANLGLEMPSADLSSTRKISNVKADSRVSSSFYPRKGSGVPTAEELALDDDEEEEFEERKPATSEMPPEYWSIQKLLKYLSGGNQTATVIAMCSIRDFDLTAEPCQYAIRDVGGLDVLINLLETDDIKCKIGALQILRDASSSFMMKKAIADINGIKPLVKLVAEGDTEKVKCLAAETLASCAKYFANRVLVRQTGGIEKLVTLLHHPTGEDGENNSARCAALALESCSKSKANRARILDAHAYPTLALLLKSENVPLVSPVVGVLAECAKEQHHRELIRELDMIPDIVGHLKRDDEELQTHCATALFRCAADERIRAVVREHDGLEPLVKLLSHTSNLELVVGASGAIWKCAMDPDNVPVLQGCKAVEQLIGLLQSEDEDVLINVSGAISVLATDDKSRKALRSAGGVEPLVKLLTSPNETLLENVTLAVGKCAGDKENMALVDKLDGVRLLWSLLKSSNPKVQANSAWAICPCIENAKNAGDIVRSFVGGLELIVGLLRSDHLEVLASVCAAIAIIARDQENLAVITDHGVVPLLGNLTRTNDDLLRQHLAGAVGNCCSWDANRRGFGEADAVAPLVKYLKSKDPLVHRATAKALFELSRDPDNCVTMHEGGVVRLLLGMVGSPDRQLQEAAAKCISNIRRLALANEMNQYH